MTKPTPLESHIETRWGGLTRQLTPGNIAEMVKDSKVETSNGQLYLHVPSEHLERARHLFTTINVVELGKSKEPGLLALAWDDGAPLPYCVPGGRFNEVYGWDSYFIVLGLLESGQHQLASNMLRHHCYEIDHYGMVLNANRSYYLNRSQPPFLTDMALQIWNATKDNTLLEHALEHAITEYTSVWTAEPRLDPGTGLSRYRPEATHQIPIEVEPGHFNDILAPFADQSSLSITEFTLRYNSGLLKCPKLDLFLRHDLGVRESGHDTSSRLYNVCADLATVDLNSLLYKYEVDIATICRILGKDPANWQQRAETRKSAVLKYMWNEQDNIFYDYNTETQEQHRFPSATSLWVLWAGLAPKEYAAKLVPRALELFEQLGGLATTTKQHSSRRQWDFPAGWPPQQILAWQGLKQYGFHQDAHRLSAKWVDMVTRVWKSEGLIFEKYNVVDGTHGVDAEYGNQGTFSEGFGWTNASILLARQYRLLENVHYI